ncbi:MAG: adenosylcobinamide-GDP ribazoletransferase [Deltaproteobacteria bacterium]|nr:adenosylcobinamide-GDP ribazoletransferase [Deltaproteobacteria bacterium]
MGEQPSGEEAQWWRGGPLPSWADLLAAVAWLTVLPVAPVVPPGAAAFFYPVVGALAGGCWWLMDRLLGGWLPPLPRAGLALGLWLAATAARPADGLLRTGSALIAGHNRARALSMLAEPEYNACGWLTLSVTAALQLWSLTILERGRLPALLFAPVLGGWAMVVLAHGARAARSDGRRLKYASAVGFREFAFASVFTFGVLFTALQEIGILVGVSAAAAVVGLRLGLHHWLDGITDATCRAGAEVVLTLALVLFAIMEARS